MEARGYQGGEGRSKFRILKWQARDSWATVSFVALTIILVVLRA